LGSIGQDLRVQQCNHVAVEQKFGNSTPTGLAKMPNLRLESFHLYEATLLLPSF